MNAIKHILDFWNRASLFAKIYIFSLLLVGAVTILGESSEEVTEWLSSLVNLPGTNVEREVVVWLATIIMSALGGGFILSTVSTRSLSRLRAAVEHLSQGDLETRISGGDLRRGDELGELSRGFNRMADTLVGLLENERRLLRDMSHELRSPLARMKMAMELLEQEITMSPPEQAQKFLTHLGRDMKKMDEMVGQLLERARLNSIGTLNEGDDGLSLYHPDYVDLCRLVRESGQEALQNAVKERKTIVNDLPERAVLWADPQLLRRITDNLIKNAFIYTAPGTAVIARIRSGENCLTLEVIDHGPGVKSEHLENIFRPFYRTNEARERVSGGFGLGLAIVWQAVHILDGSIWAENADDTPGGGLRVTVTLPVKDGQAKGNGIE
ncbi:MAG: HAMP domain-containing histidine kinase [Deltaproteobacteria bacterium]|nr:HAMP domain-containing histidine kinase [Deltaproteobacteria bacterium]